MPRTDSDVLPGGKLSFDGGNAHDARTVLGLALTFVVAAESSSPLMQICTTQHSSPL